MTQSSQKPQGMEAIPVSSTQVSLSMLSGERRAENRSRRQMEGTWHALGGHRASGSQAARPDKDSPPGSPGALTVEVLGCLPPQGLQAHLGVGPLQDQSAAVQVGAVTQGLEGSLGKHGQDIKVRVSGDLLRHCILSPSHLPAPQAQRLGSGPCDTCSLMRAWELLGTLSH